MFFDHPNLTGSDEKADSRGVPVLKPLEVEGAGGAGEDRDGGTSLASTGGDNVAVSGHNVVNHAKSALGSGAGSVADVQRSRRAKLVELDTAGTRHGEVRGNELVLVGEEEDDAALLARVAGGNVEVEDSAVARAQVSIVLSSVGSLRRVLVDRDDGVRGLVSAGEGGLASVSVSGTAGRGR